MNVDLLLTRLEGVRRSGRGWRANCPNPAHSRVKGSLSISVANDDRILLACFACQDTGAVLGALGLDMADLFPERIRDPSPEARREAHEAFKRSSWAAALGVLAREAGIVLMAASDLARGIVLPADDLTRLAEAVDRIQRAQEVLV